MAFTEGKIRVIIRWIHIISGLIIMCYVYSPFHKIIAFQLLIKFVILPVVIFTGIWIWKFKPFNKFFGIKN